MTAMGYLMKWYIYVYHINIKLVKTHKKYGDIEYYNKRLSWSGHVQQWCLRHLRLRFTIWRTPMMTNNHERIPTMGFEIRDKMNNCVTNGVFMLMSYLNSDINAQMTKVPIE